MLLPILRAGVGAYVIVITWTQEICLIYKPKPKGRRPEDTTIYIRQIPSAHVISDIRILLRALHKNLPKPEGSCSAVIIKYDST